MNICGSICFPPVNSEIVVNFSVDVIAEQESLEEIENKLSCFGSEPVDLQEQADVFEHIGACKQLRHGLCLFSQIVDGLHLVDTVQQIAHIFDHIFFAISQLYFFLESIEGCIDSLII